MASNGLSPVLAPASPTSAGNPLDDSRLSGDSDRSPASPVAAYTNGLNGHDSDPVARLERELQKTREEKDSLAAQYRNLLQKLTHMKTTLGTKLKQDAVCVSLLRRLLAIYSFEIGRT